MEVERVVASLGKRVSAGSFCSVRRQGHRRRWRWQRKYIYKQTNELVLKHSELHNAFAGRKICERA